MSRLAGITLALAVAAGCAVKLDGTPVSPSPSPSSSSGGVAPNARTIAYEASLVRPPPTQPADPWRAVDGDRPRQVAADPYGFKNGNPMDCRAAHDHCLSDAAWFLEDPRRTDVLAKSLRPHRYTAEDPDRPWDSNADDHTALAHRTVPVTRQNLAVGALVVAQPYPKPAPESEADAAQPWIGGYVESIDWRAGKLRLVDRHEVVWLSSARVVVLTWTPGRGVEIRGPRARDQLAVASDDTIAPTVDRGAVADPWSQVGADGQPIAPTDDVALESTGSVACDPSHDHCLRPWVWFVEDARGAWPSRWRDGALHVVQAIDRLAPHRGRARAYRTAPATAATLARGVHVIYRSGLPASEAQAITSAWAVGTVAAVHTEGGVFKVEGDTHAYPIAAARIAVVVWYPGERAEAIE